MRRKLPTVLAFLALTGGVQAAVDARSSMQDPALMRLGSPAQMLRAGGGNQDIVSFSVVVVVGLSDITAIELLGPGGSTVDEGTSTGTGWNPVLSGDVGGTAPTTSMQRTSNPIWQAWVDKRIVSALQVQYSLLGLGGTPDALVSDTVATSVIAVTITPTPMVEYDRNGRLRLIGAGAIFTCDVAGAEIAGRYEGVLTVTLSVI